MVYHSSRAPCTNVQPKVTKIEGVFSGTMSYIFNNFSTGEPGGPSFSDVVSVAREKGYTVRPLRFFLQSSLYAKYLIVNYNPRSLTPQMT